MLIAYLRSFVHLSGTAHNVFSLCGMLIVLILLYIFSCCQVASFGERWQCHRCGSGLPHGVNNLAHQLHETYHHGHVGQLGL